MQNYQIHTVETAPENSKPLLELFIHAVGFVPNLAGAVANSPVLAKSLLGLFQNVHGGSFTEAEVQVPKRKAPYGKGSRLSIQTEDGVADRVTECPAVPWAGRIGVGQNVLPGSGGAAHSTFRVLMAGSVVTEVPHHILVGAYVSGVTFAQRPAVAVRRLELDREATAVDEQRRDIPAAEYVADYPFLAGVERRSVVEEEVEVEFFVVGLQTILAMQVPGIDGGKGACSLDSVSGS